ncbi:Exocyst complex component 5 [Bulinus truncatus]|nr:Exocyst complex component 5 [Bulinus truncatus]
MLKCKHYDLIMLTIVQPLFPLSCCSIRADESLYTDFQTLDERISYVATKVVHLGDQLEGLHHTADVIQKLHLIALELPVGGRFDIARQRIAEKYDALKELIEEFRLGQQGGDKKKIAKNPQTCFNILRVTVSALIVYIRMSKKVNYVASRLENEIDPDVYLNHLYDLYIRALKLTADLSKACIEHEFKLGDSTF